MCARIPFATLLCLLLALAACRDDDFQEDGGDSAPETTPESSLPTSPALQSGGTSPIPPGSGAAGPTSAPGSEVIGSATAVEPSDGATPASTRTAPLAAGSGSSPCIPFAGGARVVIPGVGFEDPMEVLVDGVAATDVEVETDRRLNFASPALSAERRRVDLLLRRADGAEVSVEDFSIAHMPLTFRSVSKPAPSGFTTSMVFVPEQGEVASGVAIASSAGVHWWRGLDAEDDFAEQSVLAGCDAAWSLAMWDVTGSGREDLLVGCGTELVLLEREEDGSFREAGARDFEAAGVGGVISEIVAFDSGEGARIVLRPQSGSALLVTAWQEGEGFATPTALPIASLPTAMAVGDIKGNGFPDLLTSHFSAELVRVWVGREEGDFESPLEVSMRGVQQMVVAVDGQSGERLLGVAANDPQVSASVWRWDDEATLVRVENLTQGGLNGVNLLDLTGDGALEGLASSGAGLRAFHRFEGEVVCGEETAVQDSLMRLGAGDLTGDGYLDIFSWNTAESGIRLVLADR